ncbi:MAG: L,D-transpeptidase [Nitriliruptor sp.]|nr:MAG: L,D-transpeptidase [Nitriliruptor sp.]
MNNRHLRRGAAIAAAALLLSACGAEEEPPEESAVTEEVVEEAPTEDLSEVEEEPEEPDEPEEAEEPETRSLVATSTVDEVEVFAEPSEDSELTHTMDHPTERGVPRVFLVEERDDGWLEVLLPVRPNGSTGWIREADVDLAWNPYEVEVNLADFRMTIHREDELIVDETIGYGDEDTPTPGGRYYITELLQPPDPTGVYGPFAFGLSGFSDVHLSFAGGEGVIGIHGTNEPDSIGSTVSNGCIRVDNDVITDMASFLPLGTPVTIS